MRTIAAAIVVEVIATIGMSGVRLRADVHDPPPSARRDEVVDLRHGERIPDPYRWLEDVDSPGTRDWIVGQDAAFRTWVDGGEYRHMRGLIDRFAVDARYGTPVKRGDTLYFLSFSAGANANRQLMAMAEAGGEPRVVIGREQLQGGEALVAFSPSRNGRYIAYAVARGASRWLRLLIWDTQKEERLSDELDGLHTSAAAVAWGPDDRHFYYGRFRRPPEKDEMNAAVTGQALARHRLGTPQAADDVIMPPAQEPTRWYLPRITDDGRYLVIRSAVGSSSRERLWIANVGASPGPPRELSTGADAQLIVVGNDGPTLVVQTDAGAPRHRIVAVDPARPGIANWREIIPEPPRNERIVYANIVADRVIVFRVRDAMPDVTIHDLSGGSRQSVALPPLTTVWGPGGGGAGFLGSRSDREAYFVTNSFADPGTVYRLDPATGEFQAVITARRGFDTSDYVGERVFYTSRDGTRIPMFIARRRDTPVDGSRAVLMYGYGALGWSAFPWFQPQVLAWIESGGIYALPCIRGGGEYGEAWHQAGYRENRQTAIDDYVAAAEWLVDQKYAAAGRVVANGGSLSGFVAAAAVLQRPGAFGAALIDIPVLDLLRYDRVTGAAAWVEELGSPADPVQFRALKAISPYHNISDALCTPATLITAGERDQTAAPWHAYKYAAALQHAQSCSKPVLLQVAWGAGHAFGASAADSRETWARQLAFVRRAMHDAVPHDSAGSQAAGTAPPALPRCDGPEYRQFDFWLGAWDVRPAQKPGAQPMSNVITAEHHGCVVLESWTGGRVTGQSFNIYDRVRRKWHQTWVDSTGELHQYWGTLREDGAMAFAGEAPGADGKLLPTRLTFFPLDKNTVRQLSESSTDGGRTWSVNYDFTYSRRNP